MCTSSGNLPSPKPALKHLEMQSTSRLDNRKGLVTDANKANGKQLLAPASNSWRISPWLRFIEHSWKTCVSHLRRIVFGNLCLIIGFVTAFYYFIASSQGWFHPIQEDIIRTSGWVRRSFLRYPPGHLIRWPWRRVFEEHELCGIWGRPSQNDLETNSGSDQVNDDFTMSGLCQLFSNWPDKTYRQTYDYSLTFNYIVRSPQLPEWWCNPVWPWRWCHDRKFLGHGFAFVRSVADGWAGVSAMRVVWLGRWGVMEPERGTIEREARDNLSQ